MRYLFLLLLVIATVPIRGGTLAIMQTSLGDMALDLFDGEKPETVRNFLKYVQEGRYNNMIVQRWVPKFVIQGGGYYLETNSSGSELRPITKLGNITNEYSVGKTYSNDFGTIAMARVGGQTNSASSEWFLNLTNNARLDTVDGGFTVFGKVIGGTNTLNLFYPPPPANGLYLTYASYKNKYNENVAIGTPFDPILPVTTNVSPSFDDLVVINVKLIEAKLNILPDGAREITWNSANAVPNIVEVTSRPHIGPWNAITNVSGNGGIMKAIDPATSDPRRFYRVKMIYP